MNGLILLAIKVVGKLKGETSTVFVLDSSTALQSKSYCFIITLAMRIFLYKKQNKKE